MNCIAILNLVTVAANIALSPTSNLGQRAYLRIVTPGHS